MTNKFTEIFGWVVAAVIVAAIIGGLLIVGGPGKARDQKIDAKRLLNMHMTARVISCYADNNNGLPQMIKPARQALETGALSRSKKQRCKSLKWETDPATEVEFEYKRLGQESFELCGIFAREGDERSGQKRPIYNRSNRNVLNTSMQREAAGRFCYAAKDWD